MSMIAFIFAINRCRGVSATQIIRFTSQIINEVLLSLLFDDVNRMRHGSRYVKMCYLHD